MYLQCMMYVFNNPVIKWAEFRKSLPMNTSLYRLRLHLRCFSGNCELIGGCHQTNRVKQQTKANTNHCSE